jgi:hypothetical protein
MHSASYLFAAGEMAALPFFAPLRLCVEKSAINLLRVLIEREDGFG